MSQESGTATFLAHSSSNVDIQDPIKRPKISYTRDFLLSLGNANNTVKLSGATHLSISSAFDDATGLLSPPFCVQDSGCQASVPHNFSLKVLDNVNRLLHRSNEPYRPPCRYKALAPSTRDSSDLFSSSGDNSGSSESANREKTEWGRWRKDTVRVGNEDNRHSSKNSVSKDSPEEFLISPATKDSDTLQFTSNVINSELNALRKPTQVQDAVRRGDAGQPSILLETVGNCSSQRQRVQSLITNGTMNLWKKSVNHIKTDNGMHHMESEECSNLDLGHSDGNAHIMKSLTKSTPPGFSSWQDVKQVISDSMKQNPASPGYQIQQDWESNFFSSSLDGKSNSSSELCLPDEDSLITFDESFLMLDVDSVAQVDSFMPGAERNSIKADVFCPSSPQDMVEKLVESLLDEESSIVPHMDDPKFHHGDELGGSCYSMHMRKSYAQVCSNQSNAGWYQDRSSFQRNSVNSAIYSLFSHSYPFSTVSSPFPYFSR